MGMRHDLYNLIEDGITPEEVLSKNLQLGGVLKLRVR